MGSSWKGAWEGSRRESFGFFWFFGKEIWGSVSLGLRSGGCRKKTEKKKRRGEQEVDRRK
jgi:hypothetical protein